MKSVTCKQCGRVFMGVTLEYAQTAVKEFNDFIDGASDLVKEMYDNHRASIDSYLECFCCGNTYENFRDAVEGDCPRGCTMSPILYFTERSPEENMLAESPHADIPE